jgi:hypothetical protein
MIDILRDRPSLLWLCGPVVLFVVALPFVNGPSVLGPWLLGSALLTPLFVWLAARRDPWFTRHTDMPETKQPGDDSGPSAGHVR